MFVYRSDQPISCSFVPHLLQETGDIPNSEGSVLEGIGWNQFPNWLRPLKTAIAFQSESREDNSQQFLAKIGSSFYCWRKGFFTENEPQLQQPTGLLQKFIQLKNQHL